MEPGDIFSDIPFPSLKYPLEWFRASPNRRGQSNATIFSEARGDRPQLGDTARGSFAKRSVILLSWECEIDAVFRDHQEHGVHLAKRYWLAAPIKPVSDLRPRMAERTAQGRQPNKFLLPPGTPESGPSPFGRDPQYIDLRQITPITVPYFTQERKIGSLSESAILAMQAHIGMFFSGLVIYVQPIDCPNCGQPIDPTTFVAASADELDVD
jgi:hypothetical protein